MRMRLVIQVYSEVYNVVILKSLLAFLPLNKWMENVVMRSRGAIDGVE